MSWSAAIPVGTALIWLLILLLLSIGALEAERQWTRARRKSYAAPGALAYALDTLSVLSMVLFLVQLAGLVVRAARFGTTWIVARPLVVGGLGVLVVALAAGFVASRRRKPQPSHAAGPATVDVPMMVEPTLVGETGAVELYGISTLQRRPAPAIQHPQSFLDLRSNNEPEKPLGKRRSALVPVLMTLVVVGVLIAGGTLYRTQLFELAGRLGQSGAAPQASVAEATQPENTTALPVPNQPPVAQNSQPNTTQNTERATMRHVKSAALNVRAGPGVDQKVIMQLAQGDAVVVLNETQIVQDTEWVKVRIGEREGWVSGSLLE